MTALERAIPEPRLHQLDHIDVGVPQARAWEQIRHLDFSSAPLVRALFALRTIPERLSGGHVEPLRMSIDDITSAAHGFRMLDEQQGSSITVGAIGKVWQPDIEFADVEDAGRFTLFDEPGWVKVAWQLRCEPLGATATRVTIELRVSATDDDSWRRFTRYFRLIGPFSHFIRRHMLARLARQPGRPAVSEGAG